MATPVKKNSPPDLSEMDANDVMAHVAAELAPATSPKGSPIHAMHDTLDVELRASGAFGHAEFADDTSTVTPEETPKSRETLARIAQLGFALLAGSLMVGIALPGLLPL